MKSNFTRWLFYLLIGGGIILSAILYFQGFFIKSTDLEQNKLLYIEPKSSIVFIGNTFIDRMQLFGYFESFLHSQFPSYQLKIRNMGWPADEVALRPRPEGFGDMHRYLKKEKADIIFACYGLNESFKGPDSLQVFAKNLRAWLKDLSAHRYNGKREPEIVLISPMAFEALENLPDGQVHNKRLRLYTDVMEEVARELKLIFVDLFTPTLAYISANEGARLTYNGIHLTEYGDWRVSHMMAQSLFDLDAMPATILNGQNTSDLHDLRRAVYDKNYSFSLYWRGPNMEYIYGSRNDNPGANRMDKERGQLENIIQQLDEIIWTTGKPGADSIWHYFPPEKTLWASTPSYTGIQIPKLSKETLDEPLRGDDKAGEILSIEEALQAFHLPEGYEINLFASEKNFPLANPMAMNFDNKGRLWVANTPTWPHPLPGVQPEDFIVILEDSDHNGQADKHTIFLDKLNMIHGFTLGFGGAFISQTPNLIFAKDTNNDDVADSFETIMQGFGAEDAEHSINNLTWAPDGSLYFLNGIFFHSQVETPYGPVRMRDAGVFRYEPRKQKLDAYLSHFFWNPWGLVFNSTGQGILLDASSGDLYNMTPMAANFNYPKSKHNYGSAALAGDNPEEKMMHELLSFAPEGIGPAASIGIIQNSHFPKEAQGRLLSNQIEGWRGTHWFDILEKETNYELKKVGPELLFSEDRHFRPVAITFGIDGALYILDFYSPIFENTAFPKRSRGRDHSHGRIWRITYPTRPLLKVPKFKSEPTMKLLDLLKTYEAPTRFFARRELQEREPSLVLDDLNSWVNALDKNHQQYEQFALEALWIYQGLDVVNEKLLKQLLRAQLPEIRSAATRVLRFWQGRINDSFLLLQRMVNDENMRVRLESVIACGYSLSPAAYETAEQAADHPMDVGMEHALNETLSFLKTINPLKVQNLEFTSTAGLLALPMSESVCQERLVRNDPQIGKTHRLEALKYLAELNKGSIVTELIKVFNEIAVLAEETIIDNTGNLAIDELITIFLSRNQEELAINRRQLEMLAMSIKSPAVQGAVYMAIVIVDENILAAWELARSSETDLDALINSIQLLPDDQLKKSFYNNVSAQLQSSSPLLRQTSILALVDIPFQIGNTFETLEVISSNKEEAISIRFAALEGLSKLARNQISEKRKEPVINKVEIGIIPSKMEYDNKHFTVTAGAPIEITFTNSGIQPHNLLVCMPGQLELVAKTAESMSVQADALSKHFTPDIKEVLYSTPMIAPRKSFTLQFFAPDTPGLFPYVCTFPGHWRTMNGVMSVGD